MFAFANFAAWREDKIASFSPKSKNFIYSPPEAVPAV
jgi:hypothetical protein